MLKNLRNKIYLQQQRARGQKTKQKAIKSLHYPEEQAEDICGGVSGHVSSSTFLLSV